MQKLWLATYDSEDESNFTWFIFPSDQDDEKKAEKKAKQVYKTELGCKFTGTWLDVFELDNVENYKIKLVPRPSIKLQLKNK